MVSCTRVLFVSPVICLERFVTEFGVVSLVIGRETCVLFDSSVVGLKRVVIKETAVASEDVASA